MKTLDWPSMLDPKVLLIGENSTLQWKDEVIKYAMFLDYHFNPAPYDLGERSRWSEAKAIFDYLKELTAGKCKSEQVYGTLLSNDLLERPLKGKHLLISEDQAKQGVEHIKSILQKNPSIKYIFAMGLQGNYYLQKLGLYDCGELTAEFLRGAEARRVGLNDKYPFYQPINAKPFREICFKTYAVKGFEGVQIIPILPGKSYPLRDSELNNFGDNFEKLKLSFEQETNPF